MEFASELFNETFKWEADDPKLQDVVKSTPKPPDERGAAWGEGRPSLYRSLNAILPDDQSSDSTVIQRLAEVARANGVPLEVINGAQQMANIGDAARRIGTMLYGLLQGDMRLRQLQNTLAEKPRFLQDLA